MNVELYLKENIDDHIVIKLWRDTSTLPVFIRNLYNFYEMTILDTNCILLEILDETPGIDMIQKHIKRIEELANKQTVLYYKEITRYRRKSLIEYRIPFVIEDGQMFLPFLSLNLKKAQNNAMEETSSFSASTQQAYLFFLYNEDVKVNVTEFAKKMDFTVMTASRALNDLLDAKLVTYEIGGKTGRSKEYRRVPDPEYFEIGRAYFKSPVKQVIYVKQAPDGSFVAGLDALAELSMLNPPDHSIRAVSGKRVATEVLGIIRNKDIVKDAKLVELELWNYDPARFSEKNHVDLMSLYSSLKEDKDERVEQALKEVLRGESWYTD